MFFVKCCDVDVESMSVYTSKMSMELIHSNQNGSLGPWTFKLALKTMVETLYRSRGRQSTAPVLLFYSLKTHQMSASFLETHLCIHPIHALEEMLLSPSPTGKHLFHRCSLETPLQIACCPKWHPHLEHRNSTFSGVVFSSSWISRDGSDIQDWCCLQSSKH